MFDRPVSLNESGENGITPRCFVQVPGFFFHSASSDGLDLTNLEHWKWETAIHPRSQLETTNLFQRGFPSIFTMAMDKPGLVLPNQLHSFGKLKLHRQITKVIQLNWFPTYSRNLPTNNYRRKQLQHLLQHFCNFDPWTECLKRKHSFCRDRSISSGFDDIGTYFKIFQSYISSKIFLTHIFIDICVDSSVSTHLFNTPPVNARTFRRGKYTNKSVLQKEALSVSPSCYLVGQRHLV